MNGAIRKMLFLAAACTCIVQSVAATIANKTYFSARNELQQNGRSWAATAPFAHATPGDRGITTSALGFYSKSTNSSGLGRCFGSSLKSDYSDANGTVKIDLSSSNLPNGLFDRQIDHTYSTVGGAAAMYGTMKLAPVQKRFGVIFGADFDLDKIASFKGWHAAVTLPVVRVTNNLGVTYPTSATSVAGTYKAVSAQSTIAQFFAGNYTQASNNSQQSLLYGKVLSDDMNSTGAADMKVTVGYDIVNEIDGAVQVRAGIIVPLGAHPTAERLFEAVHGNGSHVGLLIGGRGDFLLWENKEKRMALWGISDGEFTFLLGGREKRIAGVYNSDAAIQAVVPWGHAALGVQYQQSGTFPLANVLARDMDVMPGAHFDSTLGLTLTYKDFYFNVGYNMFFSITETVDMADQWPTDRYGMATYAYQAGGPANDFIATSLGDTTSSDVGSSSRSAVGPLNVKNSTMTHLTYTATGPVVTNATVLYQVDTSVCTGADKETHQAVIGAGYHAVLKGIPIDAALCASYEVPFDSSKAIGGWALGAKISMYL